MPIIPAFRNEIINTRDDATLLGNVELSLSPGKNTRDVTYHVSILRAKLRDDYEVGWSGNGEKRIFPVGDENAKGIELRAALDQGLAYVIEYGGNVSSDPGLHESRAERQPQPQEGGIVG